VNRILAWRLRSAAVYIVAGVAVGALVGVFTSSLDEEPAGWAALRGAITGALVGAGLGVGEEFAVPRWSRRLGFARLSLIRFGAYLLVVQGALLIVNAPRFAIVGEAGFWPGAARYVTSDSFPRQLLLGAAATLFLILLLALKRLHYGSELWRLMTGRYHYPEPEERAFLYADLVDSTAIAEMLGHIAFSKFLQDVFAEVSEPILAWGGRVYQYVGDGVIVTWHSLEGTSDGACVRCFFDMVEHLAAEAPTFERTYGVVPRLTAGLHAGPVVTT